MIGRRNFVKTVSLVAPATIVAGCEHSPPPADYEPTNGYDALAKALRTVSDPWTLDPVEEAYAMSQRLLESARNILKKVLQFAIRGSSLSPLKEIAKAVRTSFEEVYNQQKSLSVELIRSDAKAVLSSNAGETIRQNYDRMGKSPGDKPYYPLYDAIADPLESLANADDPDKRTSLRNNAEWTYTIFSLGYGGIAKKYERSGIITKALGYTLLFLLNVVNWLRRNI